MTLNKSSLTLDVGKTATLTATVTPSGAPDKTVTWMSSKPTIASVDANGKVTGVAPGRATITVTTKDGNRTASCFVTVNASNGTPTPKPEPTRAPVPEPEKPVVSVSFTNAPSSLTVKQSESATATFAATGQKKISGSTTNLPVTFVRDGSWPAWLTLDGNSGRVTAQPGTDVTPGSYPVTIRAEAGAEGESASATTPLTVTVEKKEKIALTVGFVENYKTLSLEAGKSEISFRATAAYTVNGAVKDTPTVNYALSSSCDWITGKRGVNDFVITADPPADAVGSYPVTVTATAEYNGMHASATATLKVMVRERTGLVVETTPAKISLGDKYTYLSNYIKVTGTWSDGTTKQLTGDQWLGRFTPVGDWYGIVLAENGKCVLSQRVTLGKYVYKVTVTSSGLRASATGVLNVGYYWLAAAASEPERAPEPGAAVPASGGVSVAAAAAPAVTSFHSAGAGDDGGITAVIGGTDKSGGHVYPNMDAMLSALTGQLEKVTGLEFVNGAAVEADKLAGLKNLAWLSIAGCDLTELDLSGLSNKAKLVALSLYGCEKLTVVNANGCSELESLSVMNCPALQSLSLNGTKVTDLPLYGCPALKTLSLADVPALAYLKLDSEAKLASFKLTGSQVTELDLRGNLSMNALDLRENEQLATLYVSGSKTLKELNLSGDVALEVLDVSNCPALKKLNVNGCRALYDLSLYGSDALRELDLTGVTLLSNLDCGGKSLGHLDLDELKFLEGLTCTKQVIGSVAMSTTMNLGAYVGADPSRVSWLQALDENGADIAITAWNAETGAAEFASVPSTVIYFYDTGFEGTEMDVTLSPSAAPAGDTPTSDKDSGGCDAGFGLAGLLVLCGLVATRKK